MWIPRHLSEKISTILPTRPALLLTGVRQSGKSSLLRRLFPDSEYVTLDRIAVAQSAQENPESFLQQFDTAGQVTLDEIQYAPNLFRELKIRIDAARGRFGKWILTGSQYFSLMKDVSESLAGRVGIIHLHTLSAEELRNSGFFPCIDDLLWCGGYPEIWAYETIDAAQFCDDYIQTYLERDLRQIINVSNLLDFQRFMRSCAIRAGQLVNFAEMAKDIGVSAKTVKSWINTLEISGLIHLLPPYSANLGKRLIKSPKLFFADQGILCNLLNIRTPQAIEGHIHEGSIWENFVFTELLKHPKVGKKNLFFYRDQNNVEIDFLIEMNNTIYLIEAKASERVDPKKLNFRKVGPLFSTTTRNILACRTKETLRIPRKEHDVINPMKHDIFTD